MALGEAQYNLAQVDEARKTYVEALKIVRQGEEGDEWRHRLLRVIADIDMQRLDWKRAIVAYNELNKSDPGDTMIARSMIDLYYNVGKPEAAMQQLDRHLVYLVRNGRGGEVPGILRELIEERPNDAGLVNRVVRLQVHQGKNEQAIQLLDQLSESQLDAGEDDAAIATIEKILALQPADETKYLEMIESLRSRSGIDDTAAGEFTIN